MYKGIKKFLLTVALACVSVNVFAAENTFFIAPDEQVVSLKLEEKKAWIDGKKYTLPVSPKMIENRLYLPYKFILQNVLDAQGEWNADTKQATIRKNDVSMVLEAGSKNLYYNDSIQQLPAFPRRVSGYLMIPASILSDYFDVEVDYNKQTKVITLKQVQDLSKPVVGTRPTADFIFEKDSYIAGQTIGVIDQSCDKDGEMIVEKQWQINNDKQNRAKRLDDIFHTPKEGKYYVSLRVKDASRNWSEWTTKEIVIKPNEVPIVDTLTLKKESVAQGEEIKLDYTYKNEDWEQMEEEIWTYECLENGENSKIEGKPEVLFYPGKFRITLQLKDAYGNISEPKEIMLHVTQEIKQSELDYKFKEGKIGARIDNLKQFNFHQYTEVKPKKVVDAGTKLLMSNSPESVSQKGILYQDTIKGEGRILYHHKNTATDGVDTRRLVIVIENTTTTPVTVVKRGQGTKGPVSDVLYVGQQALQDYFMKDYEQQFVLKPAQKKYIYDTKNRRFSNGDTVSGILDMYCSDTVKVTIAMVGKNTKITDINKLPFLPKDGIHTRGSFENADRYYEFSVDKTGPVKLLLGLSKDEKEKWLEGYDVLTGEKVVNKGNYGMLYKLRITPEETTGVLINPRGTLYKGFIKWTGGKVYEMPSKGVIRGSQQAIVAGVLKEEKQYEVSYMLPSGSSAPVLFCFIPETYWND